MPKQQTAIVVGAGVVGLAIGRALALADYDVLILEAKEAVGTQTSSRNSEVIHAGITYTPGSLKAKLCLAGRHLLYAYCKERGIHHRQTGKLIVATNAQQIQQLEDIHHRAVENGVDDLQWKDAAQAQELEPALACIAALFSPSTGIVDSHALMLSLHGDIENAGGMLVFQTEVTQITPNSHGFSVQTGDGTQVHADVVINAAGHGAIPLAHRIEGLAQSLIPPAHFVKGQYFTLTGQAPFQRLIYPVPQIGGWGVHLTLDLAGQAKFGPDVQWTDNANDLSVDPAHASHFYQEIRRYWPALAEGRLQPGYAGIRPNIGGPANAKPDFLIQDATTHTIPGLINLFGIESPGLTSCLAIAEMVSQMCAQQTS